MQVLTVELRNDHVEEAAPHLRTFVDDVVVVRRDHDQRELPDVVAQSLVVLTVEFHGLPSALPIDTAHLAASVVVKTMELPVDGESLLAKADGIRILREKITLAQRHIMDCIQQVGLPAPVGPHHSVHLVRKLKTAFGVTLEINQL